MNILLKYSRAISNTVLRLVSIGIGLLIEYREVYKVKDAQWIIVLLGLWFISVPPALWLDSLRRMMKATENTDKLVPGPSDHEPEKIKEKDGQI